MRGDVELDLPIGVELQILTEAAGLARQTARLTLTNEAERIWQIWLEPRSASPPVSVEPIAPASVPPPAPPKPPTQTKWYRRLFSHRPR